MKSYLGNTFSPMMLGHGVSCEVDEVSLGYVRDNLELDEITSVVGHEITAVVLSTLLDSHIAFNRVNLVLERGDDILVVIPNFRASEAREFTFEEISSAGYRCFHVICS
jgi:hypothetical protein